MTSTKLKNTNKNTVRDTKVTSNKDDKIIEAIDKSLTIKQPGTKVQGNVINRYINYNVINIGTVKTFLLEVKSFLLAISLKDSQYIEKNQKDIHKQIKGPIRFGLISIILFLLFFVIWASFAPLDSAIHAQGYFRLSEHRKIITHHEGGIVEKILVRDGDFAKKGDPLIILNNSRAKAEMNAYKWQLLDYYMIRSRLEKKLKLLANIHENHSIRNFDLTVDRPKNKYIDYSERKVLDLLAQQERLLNSYKSFIFSNIDTFYSRIEQKKSEIESLEERISSNKQNITIYYEEYRRVQNLFNSGLTTKDRLSELKSRLQSFDGDIKENEARIAQIKHQLAETKVMINAFLDKENVDSYEEFKENQKKLNQIKHQYLSALDTFERTVIRSPNDGEVTDLKITTIGQSLHPNGSDNKLLEIVPKDDSLVIEAEVMSKDIDSIVINGVVKIQLDAYKSRIVPRIDGRVIYVSADKFDKPHIPGGPTISYYKVKIKVLQSELNRINYNVQLKTGMPAHVFIVKGTRSLAQYLYSPIIDSFHRAFIEE
jgi:HlyD family type I secretion membrane fusion protein